MPDWYPHAAAPRAGTGRDPVTGRTRSRSAELGQHVLGPPAEEGLVVGADLLHVHLVDTGFDVLAHPLDVRLGVVPADDQLGDLLGRDQGHGVGEVLWPRQGL